MGKKEKWRPLPFFGSYSWLDDMLEDLRWEVAADEALKTNNQRRYNAANPPDPKSYQKEDKKYKTG